MSESSKTAPAPVDARMSAKERRAAFSLASIFAFRMLGLFMVLPVFTLHAHAYGGYSPALAGLAIGIYGLTQALLQIPFGMLSDRLGRRRVIVAGLVLFATGSVVAALAESMVVVIAGRALQGAGAVSAAVLALAADLTREEHRTKAMAIIGISIGLSFALAMVAGPALAARIGIAGVFWSTAMLALVGIAILLLLVPEPAERRFHRETQPVVARAFEVLRDRQLLRADFGILTLHTVMTATFVALPMALRDAAGVPETDHALFYLTALALSVLVMVPFVVLADRRGQQRRVFLGAIGVLALAEAGLAVLEPGLWTIGALVVAYFSAFNVLEATLPALVSRLAPADMRGTALGVYSTAQFLGVFLGGALGGWLLGRHGVAGVFALGAAAATLWGLVALGQRDPGRLSTRLLRVGAMDAAAAQALGQKLLRVSGVVEAIVVAEDGVAYLKVDRKRLDGAALDAYRAVAGD